MIYGITGGMGAGKTEVTNMLKAKGFKVLDADAISREVMEKDSPLLRLLVKDFGIEIINEDGTLNRRKLGDVAFVDKDKTRRLNELVQTAILVRAIERVNQYKLKNSEEILFFDVPLLFEAGWDTYVNKVILVTAPAEIRVERIKERDGLSEDEILTRINLQMPEDEKKKRADYVIENDGDMNALKAKVEALVKEF